MMQPADFCGSFFFLLFFDKTKQSIIATVERVISANRVTRSPKVIGSKTMTNFNGK